MKIDKKTRMSIEKQMLHCQKMVNHLRNTDKIDLFHRFEERLSELQHWLRIEKETNK